MISLEILENESHFFTLSYQWNYVSEYVWREDRKSCARGLVSFNFSDEKLSDNWNQTTHFISSFKHCWRCIFNKFCNEKEFQKFSTDSQAFSWQLMTPKMSIFSCDNALAVWLNSNKKSAWKKTWRSWDIKSPTQANWIKFMRESHGVLRLIDGHDSRDETFF